MSDMAELVTGVVLLCISFGALMLIRPQMGKTIWWVKKPFVGPLLSILIVAGIGLGVVFLLNYFTTIDDITIIRRQRF
jgi:hypothetical protein